LKLTSEEIDNDVDDEPRSFTAKDLESIIKPAIAGNKVKSAIFSDARPINIGIRRIYELAEMAVQDEGQAGSTFVELLYEACNPGF
jgi:hypothetical protein